jgi:hypothetical protein
LTISTISTSQHANTSGGLPYLRLNDGDTGIKKIVSFTFSVASGGLHALVLAKPLYSGSLREANTPTEVEFIREGFILPEIKDGAYLNMICCASGGSLAGATLTAFGKITWRENMPITSLDGLIAAITAGKYKRIDNAKTITPAHTATGGWHLLAGLAGYPNAGTFPGTDLLFQSCWETTGDGTNIIGLQHGGNPGGTATKHIVNAGAMVVGAAGAPWQAKLVDLQGYYRLSTTNVTGTGSRVLINANTFTASSSSGLLLTYTNDFNNFTKVRFTTTTTLPTGLSINTDYYLVRVSATTARVATSLANAIANTTIAFTDAGTGTHTMTIQMRSPSGVGCEAFFVAQTAPTAGGPNLTASSYTSTNNGAGRAFQGTPSMGAAADAYATRILNSGAAAQRYGAFLPRQGSDTGVASIQSFTWSGGTAYTGTGVVALCIAKPLLDLSLPVTGMWSERDLVNQLPSLPQVEDGACLVWMLSAAGATTNLSPFTSAIDVVWDG